MHVSECESKAGERLVYYRLGEHVFKSLQDDPQKPKEFITGAKPRRVCLFPSLNFRRL